MQNVFPLLPVIMWRRENAAFDTGGGRCCRPSLNPVKNVKCHQAHLGGRHHIMRSMKM